MNITTAKKHLKKFYPIVEEHYGHSKFHQTTPYVYILPTQCGITEIDKENPYGEYCSLHNEILLYPETYPCLETFIRVLIHEYIHYLQSPSWMTRYYNSGYFYNNHPYEVQARKAEEDWQIIYNKAHI